MANCLMPAFTRYSPIVRSMPGGSTKYFFGMSASPSYCIIPAYFTFSRGPRKNLSKSSFSNATLISMALSPRKLKKITLSFSVIGPSGFLLRAITKGGRSWSITLGFSWRKIPIASLALSNVRPSPKTCVFQPSSTNCQLA